MTGTHHLKPLLVILTALVCAQLERSAAQTEPKSTATFRSDLDIVALSVTVQNKDGSFVRELARNDFRVFEEGVEQPISVFGVDNVPVDLVLMLDTSGSMAPMLPQVQHAATVLVNSLSKEDRAAVFTFGGRITELLDLTVDREALAEAVRRLRPGGSTPLYDAVYIALKEFAPARTGPEFRRRALVVLSDGDDTASHVSFSTVLELARRTGVAIYTVLPRSPLPSFAERLGVADYEMKALAHETGAQAFFPQPTDNLDRVYGSIASELANQYSVGYMPPHRAPNVFVRVAVAVNRRNAIVRTRTGYLSAGSPLVTHPGSSATP